MGRSRSGQRYCSVGTPFFVPVLDALLVHERGRASEQIGACMLGPLSASRPPQCCWSFPFVGLNYSLEKGGNSKWHATGWVGVGAYRFFLFLFLDGSL